MPTASRSLVVLMTAVAMLLIGFSDPVRAVTPEPYRIATGLDGSIFDGGGVVVGDQLYWSVAPTSDQEGLGGIWTSDGTSAGTRKLVDLEFAHQVTRFGDGFVFVGDDGVHGMELWRSDGTVAGTAMVADLGEDEGSSSTSLMGVVGGAVLVTADDGSHGRELYRYTGSGAPQLFDLNPTALGSPVHDLDPYWRSQWTDSSPTLVGTRAGQLLFSADNTVRSASLIDGDWYVTASGNGRELWQVGATGAPSLVKDMSPGTDPTTDLPSSTAFDHGGSAALNGSAYFLITAGGPGPALWRSDGTAAGTAQAAAQLPVYWDDDNLRWNFDPVVAGGKLFYEGWTAATSYDGLWATNGSGSGSRVSPSGQAGNATALGDQVVFSFAGSGTGLEPWVSDGTSSTLLKDVAPGAGGSVPFPFTTWGAHTYFGARSSAGRDLWRTDGTSAGTVRVHDLPNVAGAVVDGPVEFVPASSLLYFWNSPDDTRHAGNELWAFDPLRPPDLAESTVTVTAASVVAFGSEAQVRVTVTGRGTPTGSVTLRDGNVVIGTAALVGGKAQLRLPADLALGAHRLTATYAGDAAHLPGTSAAITLTVKAASRLVGRIAAVEFTTRDKIFVTGTLTLTPAIRGTGRMSVLVDGRQVTSALLRASDANRLRFVLAPLRRGQHTLQITFNRSSNAMDAATGRVTVKIVRAS